MNAYINDFGCKKDDFCLVADLKDKIIGAVWVRTFSDKIKGWNGCEKQEKKNIEISEINV